MLATAPVVEGCPENPFTKREEAIIVDISQAKLMRLRYDKNPNLLAYGTCPYRHI